MVSKKIGGIYIIFIGEYFYIGSDRTILRWLKNNPPKEQKSIFNNLNIKNMRNL